MRAENTHAVYARIRGRLDARNIRLPARAAAEAGKKARGKYPRNRTY